MVDEIDEESINALRAKIVAMKAKCMTSGAKISGKKRLSAQGCGAAELRSCGAADPIKSVRCR